MDHELYQVQKNIDYYARMRACLKCGNIGHFSKDCLKKWPRNPQGEETGKVLVLGNEVRVLDDSGGTHSFIVERNNVKDFEDMLCYVIKSVYCNRKNVWLLY